jgi:hypothetical protein
MATQHYNLPTITDDQADVGQLLEDTFLQASGQLTDSAMKIIDDELYNLNQQIGTIDTQLTVMDSGAGV